LWKESLREERDQLEESLREVKKQSEEKIGDMREEVRGLEHKVYMLEHELEQERSKQIGERAIPRGMKKVLNKGCLQNFENVCSECDV
jgi:predicted  nucleic acid-binding Zn-ribbon protein